MNFQETALQYFDAFQSRDIDRVRAFFAESITLRDWEIDAKGLAAVVQANQQIFNSVKSISVSARKVIGQGDTVFAELDIVIDGSISLRVVDIIEFDVSGSIVAIRAFKG